MQKILTRHFYSSPSLHILENTREVSWGAVVKTVASCQRGSLSLFHRQKADCHNKQHLFLSYLRLRAGEGAVSLVVIVEHINNNGSLQIIDQRKQRELAGTKAGKQIFQPKLIYYPSKKICSSHRRSGVILFASAAAGELDETSKPEVV